ncbi:hypothetical protein CLAIMM_11368 [Cladophialophora immunda]|nr:hypothetical protein CLAIMM_11368 [Cladophialophora immunda]
MALSACQSSTFTFPFIAGTTLVSLTAQVFNQSNPSIFPIETYASTPVPLNHSLSFCNVSLTYSHPGYNDAVNTNVYLPFNNDWNGRLLGVGGGGFDTGENAKLMLGGLVLGYAAVSTDGGHRGGAFTPDIASVADWAILSPGNNNLPLIEDFATTSVRDTSVIGKSISTAFYGKSPKKAYWTGCSQGGRQGHMLAQRYPGTYDGILANAPAINWGEFFPNMLWPAAVMNSIKYYPAPCEIAAITTAAVKACDGLDGVVDGVISRNDLCHFDATTVVGQEINCDETGQLVDTDTDTNVTTYKVKISQGAATMMNLTWQGSTSADGLFEWYGYGRGADISVTGNTTCELADASGESDSRFNCTAVPLLLGENWIRKFIYAVPEDNLKTHAASGPVPPWSFMANITSREDYDEIFKLSLVTFTDWLETASSDLDDFRKRGGKLLTWHGGNDQYIAPNGTVDYYERVLVRDRSLRVQTSDYYRFFEAPGLPHCATGPGPYPLTGLDALVKWVEEGEAPDTLDAVSLPDATGQTWARPLCLYPKKQVWNGKGNPRDPSGWTCQ